MTSRLRRGAHLGLLVFLAGCGLVTTKEDLVVADPAGAVLAARRLIAERQADPTKRETLQPEEVPAVLRVPGLRFARVHEDHVDLILGRMPDYLTGGRIWAEVHRKHQDQATRYPDIWFFGYTNDSPDAPNNIP